MNEIICSNCGKIAKRKTPGICKKCYNASYETRIKNNRSFSCGKCHALCNRLHKGMCSKCYNEYYYSNNKDKFVQSSIKWRKNNPERRRELERNSARERWKNYSKERKSEIIKRTEARRTDAERERRREHKRKRYQEIKDTQQQKERNRISKERRRARILNVENTLTRQEWESIKRSYEYKCAYCGCSPKTLTQDHFIPISKGGNHSADNIVPACMPCNRKKWNKFPPEGFVRKVIAF